MAPGFRSIRPVGSRNEDPAVSRKAPKRNLDLSKSRRLASFSDSPFGAARQIRPGGREMPFRGVSQGEIMETVVLTRQHIAKIVNEKGFDDFMDRMIARLGETFGEGGFGGVPLSLWSR